MVTYRYEVANRSYEDLSSGRVLHNQQGTTAFPVRLASELFQRCRAHLLKSNRLAPYTLYDPCCGGAYLLTSVGFLHQKSIAGIWASDVDPSVIALAERNLSLLTLRGIDKRIEQLEALLAQYEKESHHGALSSAHRLREIILGGEEIYTQSFVRDIADPTGPHPNSVIDMVITDLPYGDIVHWSTEQHEALDSMFNNLLPSLAPDAVVAVVAKKKTPVKPVGYERLEHFLIGKRQASIFRAV